MVGPSLGDLRGKNVRSVEELEADIKQMAGIGHHHAHHTHHAHHRIPEEELHLQQQQQQQQHLRAMQQQQQQQQMQAKKMEMSAFEKFVSFVFGLYLENLEVDVKNGEFSHCSLYKVSRLLSVTENLILL
jgi:hypothetical protein